jgi:hypothetical protein
MMINAQRQLVEKVGEQLIILPTLSRPAIDGRFIENDGEAATASSTFIGPTALRRRTDPDHPTVARATRSQPPCVPAVPAARPAVSRCKDSIANPFQRAHNGAEPSLRR